MCHICAKGFLDLNFSEAVIDKILTKYQFFTKLPQISHNHKKKQQKQKTKNKTKKQTKNKKNF